MRLLKDDRREASDISLIFDFVLDTFYKTRKEKRTSYVIKVI